MDSVKYKSAVGRLVVGIMVFVVIVAFAPIIFDFSWTRTIISLIFFVLCMLAVFGIYYQIQGDTLIVYANFTRSRYPISKIRDIKPTKTWLSAPALSISKRIAISFTDKSVMKGSLPLVLSPAKQDEFIRHLLSVNPEIKIDPAINA